VLQRVAACCSVLQRVTAGCSACCGDGRFYTYMYVSCAISFLVCMSFLMSLSLQRVVVCVAVDEVFIDTSMSLLRSLFLYARLF